MARDPRLSPEGIDVVRERNFHILRSMLLNYDESIAMNENLDGGMRRRLSYTEPLRDRIFAQDVW